MFRYLVAVVYKKIDRFYYSQIQFFSEISRMSQQKHLLAVIELGGYPDFTSLYSAHGFTVHQVNSVRKAIRLMKQVSPEVIVAEFNFQSDFRDRTSSLESLMSSVQGAQQCKVIVFYEKEFAHQLERLTAQFPELVCLPFPIETEQLKVALQDS
jgi:predicted glycosyltransferase